MATITINKFWINISKAHLGQSITEKKEYAVLSHRLDMMGERHYRFVDDAGKECSVPDHQVTFVK